MHNNYLPIGSVVILKTGNKPTFLLTSISFLTAAMLTKSYFVDMKLKKSDYLEFQYPKQKAAYGK